MAEAVVSIALVTLGDLLLEEARFLSGVGGEVRALEKQLKEIKCLLKDADKRQHGSETISNWIAEIRDLAYRSEDAIETYAIKISSKRGRGFKKLLSRFSGLMNESFSLHQIGSEISQIKSEIATVKQNLQNSGIKNISQGESSTADTNNNQRWKRQTSPVESEDCFVGKDDDLKQLVSLIVDPDKQQRVISIWGTGGIGKTTIARKVYNHTNIKPSFECFAWVCITQQCRIRSVLEDILKQLIPQERDGISSLTDVELLQKLGQIQQAKRCIIVLDDLWEIEHWDGLKNAFLVQGSSSKVLMTTRKQKVADMGYAFKLGGLSPDDGWKLLKIKAFPYNDIPENFGMDEKQLEKFGKEMVRKCGYLPLIILVLGGILSEKRSIEEWVSVNENMNAYLYSGENENEIHGVLRLSYEDLPFYLKPCFLLMGQYREDQNISCDDLYKMWIAQGMISHEHQRKETLMDVAKAYFGELVSRCLVQTPFWYRKYNGEHYRCQLHDAVRELLLLEGEKEGFNFQIMNYKGEEFSRLLNDSLSSNKSRFLAIHFEGQMTSNLDRLMVHREDTRHIRSLQFLNNIQGERIEFQHSMLELEKFERLRALVFANFRVKGRHWKGIGDLIQLRLLGLSNCELDELPSSIRNLKYLQTLDLFLCQNVRVPNVLKELHRLKHLWLPLYNKEWVERNKYRLTLEGLGELESLHEFNSLVHNLKSIMTMKKLLEISTSMHDNESLSVVIHAITTNLTNLRTFKLIINTGCQIESTEEGLVILQSVFSCQTLHELLIYVPIKKLQLDECVIEISTSRIHSLVLRNCEIEDDPMQILGKFPSLEHLRLVGRAFVGEEMKCHASSFSRLTEIRLSSLPNLREWTVEQGAMPLLSSVKIEDCPRLEKIPDGFRFTQNLQQLEIIGMPELGKRVDGGEGEDFDKVRHVPSIIIR